ncbi:hypothetical protein DPEC_G00350530 [Dallia pectoralis]|uniref:Uncharacterized protein n=1 Tax=Dallia pectoralis TaxID=75939 RepID=A0ACC2F1R3_DALPE|nr:hypothetical protein DPEC_G00350530 [Dallia pectoralis]
MEGLAFVRNVQSKDRGLIRNQIGADQTPGRGGPGGAPGPITGPSQPLHSPGPLWCLQSSAFRAGESGVKFRLTVDERYRTRMSRDYGGPKLCLHPSASHGVCDPAPLPSGPAPAPQCPSARLAVSREENGHTPPYQISSLAFQMPPLLSLSLPPSPHDSMFLP